MYTNVITASKRPRLLVAKMTASKRPRIVQLGLLHSAAAVPLFIFFFFLLRGEEEEEMLREILQSQTPTLARSTGLGRAYFDI
jgi:protein-S-isoprenylcysteine O-methyltransferase Ste14